MTAAALRDILPLGLVAAVVLVDKLCLLQVQIHRPIVLCTLLGMMTGHVKWGFIAGSLWEFIWANEEPLGANIPPDESAAAAVHFLASYLLFRNGAYPHEILYLVFFAVYPAGYIFSYMDRLLRNLNDMIAAVIETRAHSARRIYLLHLAGPVLYSAGYWILITASVITVYTVFIFMVAPSVFSESLLRTLGSCVLVLSAGVLVIRLKPNLTAGRQR